MDSDVEIDWSMYSEDEGNFPDNIIETVARANTIATDHAQVLPEIRAAPCQIYTKRQENGRALNTDIPSPRRQKHSQLTHQANNTSSQQTQGDDKTINHERTDSDNYSQTIGQMTLIVLRLKYEAYYPGEEWTHSEILPKVTAHILRGFGSFEDAATNTIKVINAHL
ncbi:hypothetical protein DPMN_092894 [Dreissena polymorpha]|uniref:Uncharacterized protein n=1 Tax=Dreissena polymorpha TaxID=45954 RepID=A0A9D4R1B5_DREPO|nr:hypothetical protein DPMN_092894 [Dreissena polymorpha]